MTFYNIKKSDFVLLHTLSNLASDPYCIMYVKSIEKEVSIHGVILKTNIPKRLFTIKTHYYNDPAIIKKIENIKEINELKLIYKMYLLKNS